MKASPSPTQPDFRMNQRGRRARAAAIAGLVLAVAAGSAIRAGAEHTSPEKTVTLAAAKDIKGSSFDGTVSGLAKHDLDKMIAIGVEQGIIDPDKAHNYAEALDQTTTLEIASIGTSVLVPTEMYTQKDNLELSQGPITGDYLVDSMPAEQ